MRELFLLLIDLIRGLIRIADPCHYIVANRVHNMDLIFFNACENLSGLRVPFNYSIIQLGERDRISKLILIYDSTLVFLKERKS